MHIDGVANSTTVNYLGSMVISSGGVANSTTLNSGGWIYVNRGGSALDIVWTPCVGDIAVEDGAVVTYASRYQGVFFGASDTLLSTAMTMTEKAVDCASMYVMENGVADSAAVEYQGSMWISSGGVANSTTVNSGGRLYVVDGGVANSTTVNSSGWMEIRSGGTANWIAIANDGWLEIYDGGMANNTELLTWGAWMRVFGGTVNSTIVRQGTFAIFNDAVANETSIGFYGDMHISSGGTANGTTVNGSAYVMMNGVANSTVITAGGTLIVSDGGAANSTTVNSEGTFIVSRGGEANFTTVNHGGTMTVSNGGRATVAFNPWQGTVVSSVGAAVTYLERDAEVYFGGTEEGLISKGNALTLAISAGQSAIVYDGGVVNETTVDGGESYNYDSWNYEMVSGWLHVSSGGTANSTTVGNGGLLLISGGGKHTVSLNIAPGAVVSAYAGSVIDFTVAGRSVDDGYLINDLSRIQGDPDFSLTVSTTQAPGTYKLAQGAADFDKTVTIRNTAGFGDTLAAGGTVQLSGLYYALRLADAELTLLVGVEAPDITPPAKPNATPSTTATTSQNVTVTASFSDDSVTKQVSLDGENWSAYTGGIVFEENGTVYFRGIDAAGNVSEVTSYTVSNIERIDAPTGFAVSVNRYDVALSWAKYAAPAGVSASYEVMIDGETFAAESNSYLFENAAIGEHTFAVRTVLSNGTLSLWSANLVREVYDVPPRRSRISPWRRLATPRSLHGV